VGQKEIPRPLADYFVINRRQECYVLFLIVTIIKNNTNCRDLFLAAGNVLTRTTDTKAQNGKKQQLFVYLAL
jgi:hypothetical protein